MAENVSIAIPIVGFTVYILTIIHFLACFFIDPGYLPRASAYEAFVIEKENNILTDLSGAYYPPPRNKMVKVNGFDYEMRFCVSLNHLFMLLINININSYLRLLASFIDQFGLFIANTAICVLVS